MSQYECKLNNDRTGRTMDWDHAVVLSASTHRGAAKKYARRDPESFRDDLCTKVLVRNVDTDEKQVFHIERHVKVTWVCNDATGDYSHEGKVFLDNDGQVIPENTYDD